MSKCKICERGLTLTYTQCQKCGSEYTDDVQLEVNKLRKLAEIHEKTVVRITEVDYENQDALLCIGDLEPIFFQFDGYRDPTVEDAVKYIRRHA